MKLPLLMVVMTALYFLVRYGIGVQHVCVYYASVMLCLTIYNLWSEHHAQQKLR